MYDVFFISYAHHTVYANVVFVFCWTIGDDAIATRKEYLALSMLKKNRHAGGIAATTGPNAEKKCEEHIFFEVDVFFPVSHITIRSPPSEPGACVRVFACLYSPFECNIEPKL